MDTDVVLLDGGSLGGFEPNQRVALVVDGSRWKLDLLAGFGKTSRDVFESRHGKFDAVENEDRFVTVCEVDDDLGLGQDLPIVGCGRDVRDLVGRTLGLDHFPNLAVHLQEH